MDAEQIERVLKEQIELDEVYVQLDGANVNIIAVGDVFEPLSRVKRQQLVYAPLKPLIADGTLHAVSIKTYLPADWARDKKLVMPQG